MKILIACEESQEVCKAFRKKGFNAYSCDLLPCSGGHPEWHYQDYMENVIGLRWDAIIAFPPCTYLSSSGLHHNKRDPERQAKTEYALAFVCMILNARCDYIALENPVGCISTRIECVNGIYQVMDKPNPGRAIKPHYIQPHDFGEDASKKTGLYLKGLPPLKGTKYIPPRRVKYNGKWVERWANQTDSGQNRLGPSEDRAMLRSKTYPGIARAMADQWKLILKYA